MIIIHLNYIWLSFLPFTYSLEYRWFRNGQSYVRGKSLILIEEYKLVLNQPYGTKDIMFSYYFFCVPYITHLVEVIMVFKHLKAEKLVIWLLEPVLKSLNSKTLRISVWKSLFFVSITTLQNLYSSKDVLRTLIRENQRSFSSRNLKLKKQKMKPKYSLQVFPRTHCLSLKSCPPTNNKKDPQTAIHWIR
jgi:hypothetical protein